MKKFYSILLATALAFVLAVGVSGCKKEETLGDKLDKAAEKAGKAADEAADKTGKAVESAGEKLQD